MNSSFDETLMDADSTESMNLTQTSSSTEVGREAMDKSASNSDPPVQVSIPQLSLGCCRGVHADPLCSFLICFAALCAESNRLFFVISSL